MFTQSFWRHERTVERIGGYKFVLRGWNGNGMGIHLSGFSVPVVCGSVNGEKVKFVKSNYPFLKSLKLADDGLHKENIDLLIGADFHWGIGVMV